MRAGAVVGPGLLFVILVKPCQHIAEVSGVRRKSAARGDRWDRTAWLDRRCTGTKRQELPMGLLPENHADRISWFTSRTALWTSNSSAIGTTTAAITLVSTSATA